MQAKRPPAGSRGPHRKGPRDLIDGGTGAAANESGRQDRLTRPALPPDRVSSRTNTVPRALGPKFKPARMLKTFLLHRLSAAIANRSNYSMARLCAAHRPIVASDRVAASALVLVLVVLDVLRPNQQVD